MPRSLSVLLILLALLFFNCPPSTSTVPPARPRYFSNLVYEPAITRYKSTVEKKFQEKDLSYILSLLSYGITSFYGGSIADAKKAFMAAYRVDAGDRPGAAKLYDWLVVDSRTVYKLKKRERELVHLYLGLCYLLEDNIPEALVEFKKLRQFDQDASKLPVVNFYMGLGFEKQKKWDDALIEYRALKEMPHSYFAELGASLIRQIELQRDSGLAPQPDSVELIVHIDHQTATSIGRAEVYLDANQFVATLPENGDSFNVQLTALEANRRAMQQASAKAARLGLRLLGGLLLERALPGAGRELADDIADITLGKEEENKDTRAWGYAPLNITFARLKIPATTEAVRLVFYNRAGAMQGFCDYPLQGKNARAKFAAGTFFIIAGLAEEFYVYQN